MTKIEDFSRFRHAVETWTGEDIVPQVRAELEAGDMNIDPSDIIGTESGLFSLILKKNQIFVTKVILHISDCSLSHLNQEPGAATEYEKENYDACAILRAANKYHFLHCGTLERMFGSGRRFRYKQSRKTDGTFVYNFMSRNEIVKERRNQKLYPCRKCLGLFSQLYGGWYPREDFAPKMFFEKTFHSDWLDDCGYSQDFTPNAYPADFKRISDRVRKLRNYTCERCKRCLKAAEDRKFLHCHHLHGDKTDNSYRHLRALCIKCHSEQPWHQHMRGLPQYQEFMEKFYGGKSAAAKIQFVREAYERIEAMVSVSGSQSKTTANHLGQYARKVTEMLKGVTRMIEDVRDAIDTMTPVSQTRIKKTLESMGEMAHKIEEVNSEIASHAGNPQENLNSQMGQVAKMVEEMRKMLRRVLRNMEKDFRAPL